MLQEAVLIYRYDVRTMKITIFWNETPCSLFTNILEESAVPTFRIEKYTMQGNIGH
jgi:hypothetical protein